MKKGNEYEKVVGELRKKTAYKDGRQIVNVICWLIMLAGVLQFSLHYMVRGEGWLVDGVIAVLFAGAGAVLLSAVGGAFFDMADAKVSEVIIRRNKMMREAAERSAQLDM